jgi:hypothetical protein
VILPASLTPTRTDVSRPATPDGRCDLGTGLEQADARQLPITSKAHVDDFITGLSARRGIN